MVFAPSSHGRKPMHRSERADANGLEGRCQQASIQLRRVYRSGQLSMPMGAGDAVGVARSALGKLGKSVSQAVGALVPTEQQEARPPPDSLSGGTVAATATMASSTRGREAVPMHVSVEPCVCQRKGVFLQTWRRCAAAAQITPAPGCRVLLRERESSSLGPGLIGGLFGRAMGGMLSGAMQQLQNQQEEVGPHDQITIIARL